MIAAPFEFLAALDGPGLIAMFWHALFLEIPRYALPGALVALVHVLNPRPGARRDDAGAAFPAGRRPRVTLLLPGHNEADRLDAAIASISRQSWRPDEIVVVDDGSSDAMADKARALKRAGYVDRVFSTRLRAGKSAAANLGLRHATGDIVVIADVDTTYDDDAFERLVAPFADPAVGAVAGNLGVRNWRASTVTRWQAVQYLESISLGRRVTDMLGILYIVSGAFGAFRREALEAVGGWDVGPGEDADITVKMRRAGWRVRFAPDAWSLTDVPETVPALVRQRLRWNRSLVRIRMRKFGAILDPRQAAFTLRNALGVIDVLFFQLIMAASFAVYLLWVFLTYGDGGWLVLAAASLIYAGLGLVTFLAAAAVSGEYGRLSLLPEAVTYGLFNSFFLRFVRLYAAVDELVFRHSYADDYVPPKVRERTERF